MNKIFGKTLQYACIAYLVIYGVIAFTTLKLNPMQTMAVWSEVGRAIFAICVVGIGAACYALAHDQYGKK